MWVIEDPAVIYVRECFAFVYIVLLNCISLTVYGVECLFICLLFFPITTSSVFCIFFLLFVLLLNIYRCSLSLSHIYIHIYIYIYIYIYTSCIYIYTP